MAKTKRKHLAALGTKKKQRPLAHHDGKSDPMVEEKGHPRQPESSAQPSSTSPSSHPQKRRVKHKGEGDQTAEVSHPSVSPQKEEHNREQNDAPVPLSSPYLQPHADDSDTDSWVDVRKQRIIIIIPPLPPAKPRFLKTSQHMVNLGKDGFRCTQRKKRAKLQEAKSKGKASSSGMYGKSRREDAIGTFKSENNAERSISRRMKESICTGAPPISSMDILLASALDTHHTICTPWEEKPRQHAPTYSQEEASLDTADSSVQPRRSLLKSRKGLKAPVRSNQVAQEHIKKRKIKSVHPNMTRKRKKPQQATFVANDVLGHLLSPDIADVKANGLKHSGGDFPASSNQAVKIFTLKKHLDKAGGLRSWLFSVGLGQFKEAFEKRMWSERDLLELQMDDLKRMGKFAVGPRRKLIWAINHLSHQLV